LFTYSKTLQIHCIVVKNVSSLLTDNHARTPPLSFLQAGCPSCRPTNSVKAHTHTHPFNAPLSGTTWVNRYQKGKTNLDFTEARDSEWQWNPLGHMQVCTSLQTDNHACNPALIFLQAGCPSCRPTNGVKALTHTHPHTFNGPFSGTTRVRRYQKGKTNLDFPEARDSEWQWNPLGHMQVCTSLQTDNHASTPLLSFLQAGCPSCRPANSVKALKAKTVKQ